ncbi:MAG: SRPBCC family protein [Lautropia sp.]
MRNTISLYKKNGDIFRNTRKPVQSARHLPGDVYTSPEVLELERDCLFMRHWLCVGREEELTNVGDYLTLRVLGEPVLVVRKDPQTIAAYSNVCRHRGVEVASGNGNAQSFVCPYHAWTYSLDGQLESAPLMRHSDLNRELCRLPQLRVGTWRGTVFVNFDPKAPSLEEWMQPFEQTFGFLQPDRCALADKLVIDLDCNWKFVNENLMDLYHVGTLHADTFGSFFKGEKDRYQYELMPGGAFGVFPQAAPLSEDGRSLFGKMEWLSEHDETFCANGFLPPNMNLTARCDSVRLWVAWPQSVDKTQAISYTLIPPDRFEAPEFRANIQKVNQLLRRIVEEDRSMIQSLQVGVQSRYYEAGPLSRLELPIHHVLNSYLDKMLGDSQ